jgi:hypothetical protein
MSNGLEAFDETFDETFDEAFDESLDESRFKPRRVATARPRPLTPRPTSSPVTQAQLQAAVTKLNGDISRNSTAIQRVNTSLTTLGRDVRRQTTTSRTARKDIGQLRDALVLLPLLSSTIGTSNPMLSAIFPMLLLSGIGEAPGAAGSSGSGGMLGGGGDSSTMMMLVLAMSGAFGKQD